MKRLWLLCALLFATSVSAGDWGCIDCMDWRPLGWCEGWEVEVRGAGVYNASERFRRIYSQWVPEVQVEVAKNVCDNLFAWVNVGYLWKTGHSSLFHHKTNLTLVPITFGLNYVQPITCLISMYFGGGAAYSFLHIHDHSDYVKQHISRQGWGGVLKSGFQINPREGFFIDIFADYLFQHFRRPHEDRRGVKTQGANLDGIRVGAGIGTRF